MKTRTVIEDGKEYEVEFVTDAQCWCLNGKWHREKGPAIIHKNRRMAWYQNNLCHRLDGPGQIWPGGEKYWYINDIGITEQAHTKVRTMLSLGLDKV